MFIVGEIVRASGRGRTATWENTCGTVTRVGERSVFVQWHNCAIEDELDFDEVISTGTFNRTVPNLERILDGSEDGMLRHVRWQGHFLARPKISEVHRLN